MNPKFSKWTEDNVRHCRYMHEDAREVFLEFILRLAEEGVYVRITSGMRTKEEQKDLYRKGATWVLCPYSWHCHGLAVDIVPMKRVGPLWYKPLFRRNDVYERIIKIALKLGIASGYVEWGVDRGHFHYRGSKTIYQVARRNYPNKPDIKISPYHRETRRVIERLQNRGIITHTLFPYLYDRSS
jgi:hypothetical protein